MPVPRLLRGPLLRLKAPAFQIYGANTGVGKTIMSTHLIRANMAQRRRTVYCKPVSTGHSDEADQVHISKFGKDETGEYHTLDLRTLFQYSTPVSPHLAALDPGGPDPPRPPPSDNEILCEVQEYLSSDLRGRTSPQPPSLSWPQDGYCLILVETAGGPLSPAPSGSLQADLYRPLRLPVVLVADPRLGGISATISAFEALRLRGYDIPALAILQDDAQNLGNAKYLEEYLANPARANPATGCCTKTFKFAPPPSRLLDPEKDSWETERYYMMDSNKDAAKSLVRYLFEGHHNRIEQLENMQTEGKKSVWFPFTQHQTLKERDIVPIESAAGDFFHVAEVPPHENDGVLTRAFDGSASWWTQGLGHGNPALSLTAAYAAGRYGHVMFAGAVHEPALQLANTLLRLVENPRLTKVFYTDNGSTGVEVALKMALWATARRYGWEKDQDIKVLTIDGCYHGDTIGAMDTSENNVYNYSTLWHRDRAVALPRAEVAMEQGRWVVRAPFLDRSEAGVNEWHFDTLGDIFCLESREEHAAAYTSWLTDMLRKSAQDGGVKIGAFLMEPVILGAGGMVFIDPLFQHVIVKCLRELGDELHPKVPKHNRKQWDSGPQTWSGVPVIADEVFTGLMRLGHMSSSKMIKVQPDIAVHAKLLTGGLVPLAVTLASDSIFESFLGEDKLNALLHGHSYTAHPVGCSVALASLGELERIRDARAEPRTELTNSKEADLVDSVWSSTLVSRLSSAPGVTQAFALGTVVVVRFERLDIASSIQKRLMQTLDTPETPWKIHTRLLGSTMYIMASLSSVPGDIRSIEQRLALELDLA